MPASPSTRKQLPSWQEVLAPYSLGYRLRLLSQLSNRRLQEILEPYGLTPFHWLVLCCLWEQDGLATTEIGEKLQQVGGTMTGVLDRMEERNLVRRERDKDDRRIWRVWLTDTGKQLYDVLPDLMQQARETIMQGISDEERRIVSDFVDKAIANLMRELA